jgi:hypothetical protein
VAIVTAAGFFFIARCVCQAHGKFGVAAQIHSLDS